MRIVFMGTPDFALPSLSALVQAGHRIEGVVTQPDRPKGRGMRVTSSPVKTLAGELGIRLFQPGRVREPEFVSQMHDLKPEAIVVVAFGQKIPKALLGLPKYGCINLHASLLPRYRGASPIRWAIINGETRTGVTTIYLDEGLDTGDIILQEEVEIREDVTYGELHDLLAVKGAELLKRTLELVESDEAPRIPQDESLASYAPAMKPEDARISWGDTAISIRNLVRGMAPRPGAYTLCSGKLLKILSAEAIPENMGASPRPGEVVRVEEGRGFSVATGGGLLLVKEVQPENRRRMSALDYAHGRGVSVGQVLE